MKPLPYAESDLQQPPELPPVKPMAAMLPGDLPDPTTMFCPLQKVYPWLLFASTAVAAVFCLMYISKPVIVASADGSLQVQEGPPVRSALAAAGITPTTTKAPALLPSGDRLPGDAAAQPAGARPGRTLPPASADSPFEETNLRVQHVLTAETPDGHQSRIVLDVPVLYQSRNLRWTPAETAEARALLNQLAGHQEKTLALRAEGQVLLDAWNSLIERSIPAAELRADSPSLPANQQDAAANPRPASLDSTENIRVETPSGK